MVDSVAIIILVFNGKEFVKETIESSISQTYKNVKTIVVDDCSSDTSLSIIEKFKYKIDVIKRNQNLGITKNINDICNALDTDYFILLGHDDVLPKDHVSKMIAEFEEDVVSVHCNSYLIDKNGNSLGVFKNDQTQKQKTISCLFELSIDNFISSCGMMHKTSVFKKVGGWDERYENFGEWLYYIKSLKFGKIKYTLVSKGFYRRHATNITNTFTVPEISGPLNIYFSHCKRLAYKNNKNTFKQIIIYWFFIFKSFLRNKVNVFK